jgi:hypothetical protein
MEIKNKTRIIALLLAVLISFPLFSQKDTDPIRVDKNGRMVWRNNGQEAFFWGVNYTAPFSHAFRQIGRTGADREKAVDADAYHLSRMSANAYRIHVWDIEISDSIGNLLENDHLKIFDYMIYRFQQRGIYIFLTPILLGGNGYPEPNEPLSGFSSKYNKGNAYTDPKAIEYERRYMKQFISHVNPYTGKAYKNDPMVLGFEICNEPSNSRKPETTAFIKTMIAAIRSTGCTKPVFYNVTQNSSLLEDYIKGGTDGLTFQWYPSGLVSGHEVKGTYLPHVDIYDIPFRNEKSFLNQARLVYEFDPADVGRSYMYPPTAISFKEAGMQFVAMFAYDPLVIAKSNTEYQTHFLNLAYAPQKALGYKIAAEIFRNPQFKRDRINETRQFEMPGLKISYTEDLAEMATGESFIYTNNTSTRPPELSTLKSVAGYGTSPVVAYKGRGAYFIDKISDGVWRLEVMPDAIWVRDPFSRATPRIDNVVIKWNRYDMAVNLPDIGKSFIVKGINDRNIYSTTAKGGVFPVTPGVYILSAEQVTDDIKKTKIGVITADEYYAPAETNNNFYFLHTPPPFVSEGKPVDLSVTVVSPPVPISRLIVQPSVMGQRGFGRFRPVLITMDKVDGYNYKATIPDSVVTAGTLRYTITIEYENGRTFVWPGNVEGPATSWEYYNPDSYSITVLPAKGEILLYSPEASDQVLTYSGDSRYRSSMMPSVLPGESRLQFSEAPAGNFPGRPNNSGVLYVMQNFIDDVIKGIDGYSADYKEVLIHGRATDKPVNIEFTMISKDGNAYTAGTSLVADKDVQAINLADLKDGRLFLLPGSYPVFMPLWYKAKNPGPFRLSGIERIQLVVPNESNEGFPGFELKAITIR